MVGGAFLLIVFADRAGRATIGTGVDLLQVVWIERDDTPANEIEPRSASPIQDREAKPAVRARKAQPSRAQRDVEAHAAGGPVAHGRLDLALPKAAIEFSHGLLERPDRNAREPGLQVTFQDRSLGGTLQRMSQRTTCAELRRALANRQASHEAIMSSMARHKCRI